MTPLAYPLKMATRNASAFRVAIFSCAVIQRCGNTAFRELLFDTDAVCVLRKKGSHSTDREDIQ